MQIQVLEKSGILMKTSPCIGMNTHSLIPETGKVKYYMLRLQTECLIEGQRSVTLPMYLLYQDALLPNYDFARLKADNQYLG